MNKPFLATVFLLVAGLAATNGCSKSASKPLVEDGAAPSDAPAGSGGMGGGAEDGVNLGTGGTAGAPGTDAGADGVVLDGRQDLPPGAGGAADTNRDVATTPGTGGVAGAGGRGGSSGGAGGANTGGASSKGGSGGAGGANTGGASSKGGSGGAGGANTGGASSKGGSGGGGGSSGIDGGTGERLCSYECRTDASGVTGWYSGSKLLCAAECLGSRAVCLYGGSKSEGCYARGGGPGCQSFENLIAYTTCAPVPNQGAFLTWQAAEAATGAGPAIFITDGDISGTLYRWTSTPAFPPESRPAPVASSTDNVRSSLVNDLWKRLEALDTTSLPHEPRSTNDCSATLYFQLCKTCTATTLTYGAPASVTPEMEPIWSWFDEVLGTSNRANPRSYCMPVGADP